MLKGFAFDDVETYMVDHFHIYIENYLLHISTIMPLVANNSYIIQLIVKHDHIQQWEDEVKLATMAWPLYNEIIALLHTESMNAGTYTLKV